MQQYCNININFYPHDEIQSFSISVTPKIRVVPWQRGPLQGLSFFCSFWQYAARTQTSTRPSKRGKT